MESRRRGFGWVIFAFVFMGVSLEGCSKSTSSQPQIGLSQVADLEADQARRAMREDQDKIASPATVTTVEAVLSKKLEVMGRARIGLLYFLDRPAHRLAVLDWLEAAKAKVVYENTTFGYLEADLDWKSVGELIKTGGQLGIDETSFMKLEVEYVAAANVDGPKSKAPVRPIDTLKPVLPSPPNTSFTGPVHSAGYGSNVEEFRGMMVKEFGGTEADYNGQGTLVAVYDGGIDLRRTDVFGNRIRDFLIGVDTNWIPASQTLAEYQKANSITTVPAGLEDVAGDSTLRFTYLDELAVGTDLNGSGKIGDRLAVAAFGKGAEAQVRFQVAKGLGFGDSVLDYGQAHKQAKPAIIDLATGKYYVINREKLSPAAVAVKLREETDGSLSVAFVGTPTGAYDHGISNLHMVGGDFVDGASKIRYQGVAPGTEFLVAQTWELNSEHYGERWLPLARTIIQAAEAGSDVIDLDIYTPGNRSGNNLLSSLLCRITARTTSVPVVASHNFGPFPNTIQSLAQSPCVLGIGASHSSGALKQGYGRGAVDPALGDDDRVVQTAVYSGRGFGMNGQFKPDVISPAYAYTAYGGKFTRFGGTSGATPATSGMIALLKQAARKKGAELSFDQVKLLLQASATAPASDKVRDGYGYTRLDQAWGIFSKHSSNGYDVAPFAMTGHTYLQFDGRPTQNQYSVSLTRLPIAGSIDSPTKMKFWIEYGGASTSASSWLKLYDLASGSLVDSMQLDAPMHGELQTLRFAMTFDDQAWAALPPGDHVAIIKGVREELAADGRAVDFLLPVAVTKGLDLHESTLKLAPMYVEQQQIVSFAAKPGERIALYGSPMCLGKPVTGAVDGDNYDSYVVVLDNEAAYPHASWVMNTYGPLRLGQGPMIVTSKKGVVRLAVMRRGLSNCDGATGGEITVKRTGFEVQTNSIEATQPTGEIQLLNLAANLKLTGAPLKQVDQSTGATWAAAAGKPSLLLKTRVDGEASVAIPGGASFARFVPDNMNQSQGVLIVTDTASGEIAQQVSSASQDFSGYGSMTLEMGGDFTGLQVAGIRAGQTLTVVPAGAKGTPAARGTLEIGVDGLVLSASGSANYTDWPAGAARILPVALKMPSAKPAELAAYDSAAWSFQALVPVSLTESVPNGGNGTIENQTQVIWKGSLSVPAIWK